MSATQSVHSAPPHAVETDVTVLFTDMVGFTKLSETMPPKDVAALLNDHFTLLGRTVEETGGTIDKYIGDSLMAFWGAPAPVADHQEAACRAALQMTERLEAHNTEQRHCGRPAVSVRVGIHTGNVIAGKIGARDRADYTVIGDTVNVSSRIEALGADVIPKGPATILISEAVAAALPSGYRYQEVGTAAIRGRRGSILVYRLDAGPGAARAETDTAPPRPVRCT